MLENLTAKKIAYFFIIAIGAGFLLHIGSGFLLPIIFALLFSILLIPFTNFFSRWIRWRWVPIILGFLTVLLPMALIAILFISQLGSIVREMPSLEKQFTSMITSVGQTIENLIPIPGFSPTTLIKDNLGAISAGPVSTLGKGILSTSNMLLSITLSFLYTFFFLLYKSSIEKFIIYQFDRLKRKDITETLLEIKGTVQSYVGGLGIVMLILTILNTLGLYLIGIEYALFWGALAGILAVIPYIGTVLGGLFPFLYALTNSDYSWQPLAVIAYYVVIQQVEGNFITPKVVGDKVNINPFVAILGIVFFGTFWGLGGVVLALPLISTIRIILDQFDDTKALALLMSSAISNPEEFKKLNDEHSDVHILTKEDIINQPEND